MQNHTKIYLKYFGYGEQDFIPCEMCAARAVDIHHIIPRSRLGKDHIKNLMALCRGCHDGFHLLNHFTIGKMQNVHDEFIKTFNELINGRSIISPVQGRNKRG